MSKERGAASTDDDFMQIIIPAGKIFHQTDFDIAEFEDEVAAIVRSYGGSTVSSNQKSGNWQLTFEFPRDVDRRELYYKVKRLPEWRLPKSYGARVVFPFDRTSSRHERIANRIAAALREGDVCRVDMARVQKVWPQQLRIIKDVVRQGGGRVVVEEVRGDTAQVSAFNNPVSRMVGMVDVPIDALQVVKGASQVDRLAPEFQQDRDVDLSTRDWTGYGTEDIVNDVKEHLNDSRVASTKDDQWAEILQLIKKTNRFGEEEMVDFIAQVWNGGVEQWVINGYSEQLNTVIGVAHKLGREGQELARRLKDLEGDIESLSEAQRKRTWEESEEDDESKSDMDAFDTWFYHGIDEKIVEALLEYIKGGS